MSKPNTSPREADEARTFMQYMQARRIRFTHVKNETGRAYGSGKVRNWQAIYDYQDGVSAGFPDFAIVLPGTGLLCIELKREVGGKASAAQLEWITALNSCPGVAAHVCKGAGDCIKVLESYYPLPFPAIKHSPNTLETAAGDF